MVLQTLQNLAATQARIKGVILIVVGIILILAGPIATIITKQLFILFISLFGVIAILGGWYQFRRANWFAQGGGGGII